MTSTARRADATSPALSLSLRVALLESLVVGRSQLGNRVSAASEANISSTSRSILSRTLQAQEKLDEALKPHRPVSQFAADYGHNRPYLIPSFATLGGGTSLTSSQDAGKGEGEEQALPRGTTMTPQTQVALLLEAEQDLRDLERDLRQCQTLDERGVAGAGKLADHEALTPKLEELKASASKKSKDDNGLEEQVMSLVEDYSRYVESISQLFIHWDHALNDLELQVGVLERSRA